MKAMTRDAHDLHYLTKKRKEVVSLINQKNKELEYTLAQNVSDRREHESQKRIKRNCAEERRQQQVTSSLMLELLQICAEDNVPRYVQAIAKVLDNYQGGINTIRSNATWLAELISQLTDQMRNFDSGQRKLDAKFDLILEKVRLWRNYIHLLV